MAPFSGNGFLYPPHPPPTPPPQLKPIIIRSLARYLYTTHTCILLLAVTGLLWACSLLFVPHKLKAFFLDHGISTCLRTALSSRCGPFLTPTDTQGNNVSAERTRQRMLESIIVLKRFLNFSVGGFNSRYVKWNHGSPDSRFQRFRFQREFLAFPDFSVCPQITSSYLYSAVKQGGVDFVFPAYNVDEYMCRWRSIQASTSVAISRTCHSQRSLRGVGLLLGCLGSKLSSTSTLSQRSELNRIDYRLSDSRNGKYRGEENQSGISIFPVTEKNYKLSDFSEQFSNSDDEFDWRWLPLGIAGLICLIWGMFVFYTSDKTIGMVMFLVGWICSQIGFARCFN